MNVAADHARRKAGRKVLTFRGWEANDATASCQLPVASMRSSLQSVGTVRPVHVFTSPVGVSPRSEWVGRCHATSTIHEVKHDTYSITILFLESSIPVFQHASTSYQPRSHSHAQVGVSGDGV